MRLNERQRKFLERAAASGTWIERRGGWRSVILPDDDMETYRVVASLRGADLASLLDRYVKMESDDELYLTALGRRLGGLYTLYYATIDLYTIGNDLGHDVNEMLEQVEQLVWAKVQETEMGSASLQ